jgi:hypothetical protein
VWLDLDDHSLSCGASPLRCSSISTPDNDISFQRSK